MPSKFTKNFIILTVLLGIFIGMEIKSPYQLNIEGSFYTRDMISKINSEKLESFEIEKQQKNLYKIIEEENEILNSKIEENEQLNEYITELGRITGYEPVKGPGINIMVDSYTDTNLAYLMEDKKLFILLLNDLKLNGAEAVSVNGQRVGLLSEITLAGSHININNTPIAPPYSISAIGDSGSLYNNLDEKTPVIDIMRNAYGLKVIIKREKYISIPSIEDIADAEYIS